MSCDKFEELLVLYLDKKLSPGKSRKIEQHLEKCKRCSGTLNELKKTIGLIETLPDAELPHGLVEKTIARIERVEQPQGLKFSFRFPQMRVFVPVAASILFVIGIVYILRPSKMFERPLAYMPGMQLSKTVFFTSIKKELYSIEKIVRDIGREPIRIAGTGEIEELEKEERWEELNKRLDSFCPVTITFNRKLYKILMRRAERIPEINKLGKKKLIGEGKDALLVILDKESLSKRERKTVSGENQARRWLIEVLTKQYLKTRKISVLYKDEARKEVVEVFKWNYQRVASAGILVQNSNGEWTKKE